MAAHWNHLNALPEGAREYVMNLMPVEDLQAINKTAEDMKAVVKAALEKKDRRASGQAASGMSVI
jgi:hypothetical protein